MAPQKIEKLTKSRGYKAIRAQLIKAETYKEIVLIIPWKLILYRGLELLIQWCCSQDDLFFTFDLELSHKFCYQKFR